MEFTEEEVADIFAYLVDEGFIELEETEDGEITIWPIGEPEYLEVPQ